MPDRPLDLLFRILRQSGGTLARRARAKEFEALTEEELEQIEAIYTELQESF